MEQFIVLIADLMVNLVLFSNMTNKHRNIKCKHLAIIFPTMIQFMNNAMPDSAEEGWVIIWVALEIRMLYQEEENNVSSVAKINLLFSAVFMLDAYNIALFFNALKVLSIYFNLLIHLQEAFWEHHVNLMIAIICLVNV